MRLTTRRIKIIPKVLRTFKNWPVCFAAYLGLIRGDVTYTLRDNTRILARAGTQDIGVILDVYALDCYRAYEIGDEDVVVDIGAHIGVFSMLAAKRATRGKIFAFEPLPQNFSFLERNIQLNSANNVMLFNKAVGGKQERRRLFIPEFKGKPFYSAASFYAESLQTKFMEVEAITLQGILDLTGRIDFLKIDAEGAEAEILVGLERELFSGIKRISLECHDYYFKRAIYGELAAALSNHGFKVEMETTLFANINSEMLYARKD